MIEINKNTRQIILEGKESRNLAMEIEAAFMVLDTGIEGCCFSLDRMKELYPQMGRIYSILAYQT